MLPSSGPMTRVHPRVTAGKDARRSMLADERVEGRGREAPIPKQRLDVAHHPFRLCGMASSSPATGYQNECTWA